MNCSVGSPSLPNRPFKLVTGECLPRTFHVFQSLEAEMQNLRQKLRIKTKLSAKSHRCTVGGEWDVP